MKSYNNANFILKTSKIKSNKINNIINQFNCLKLTIYKILLHVIFCCLIANCGNDKIVDLENVNSENKSSSRLTHNNFKNNIIEDELGNLMFETANIENMDKKLVEQIINDYISKKSTITEAPSPDGLNYQKYDSGFSFGQKKKDSNIDTLKNTLLRMLFPELHSLFYAIMYVILMKAIN